MGITPQVIAGNSDLLQSIRHDLETKQQNLMVAMEVYEQGNDRLTYKFKKEFWLLGEKLFIGGATWKQIPIERHRSDL